MQGSRENGGLVMLFNLLIGLLVDVIIGFLIGVANYRRK